MRTMNAWLNKTRTNVSEWDERVRKYTAESVALARARAAGVLITQARRDATRKATRCGGSGLEDSVSPLTGRRYVLSMKRFLRRRIRGLFADSSHVFPPATSASRRCRENCVRGTRDRKTLTNSISAQCV